MTVFEVLSSINCNDYIDKIESGKRELTYLSWSWAWHLLKANYPESTYTVYEDKDGRNYFNDGRTCWVKTGVTVEGIEYIEYLPVMNYKNEAIPFKDVSSTAVNKSIQRSLTKAIARHGLGLYIYAGEDIPTKYKAPKPITSEQLDEIKKELKRTGISEERFFINLKITSWNDMTDGAYEIAMKKFAKTEDAKEGV